MEARDSSKRPRVGLPDLEYTKPLGYVPSSALSYVVEKCTGGVTAPVAGSGEQPKVARAVCRLGDEELMGQGEKNWLPM
jgi:hypothetical protein